MYNIVEFQARAPIIINKNMCDPLWLSDEKNLGYKNGVYG